VHFVFRKQFLGASPAALAELLSQPLVSSQPQNGRRQSRIVTSACQQPGPIRLDDFPHAADFG
jgi:hypothetical protein